jgi:hypothetical protein
MIGRESMRIWGFGGAFDGWARFSSGPEEGKFRDGDLLFIFAWGYSLRRFYLE